LWTDKCQRLAAALAYQTVLSLVPLIAVVVSVTTILHLETLNRYMTDFLQANLVPEAASSVGGYVIDLATGVRPHALGVVGGVTLVVLSVMLLFTVEQSINEIYRCNRPRDLWIRILVSLVLLAIAPSALGLSLYFTGKLVLMAQSVSAVAPVTITVVMLFLCYWLLPHTEVRLRFAAISALVTGVLLEALQFGFAVYVQYLGKTLSYVYGTFAILPLSMIWIYLAWLVFLFGAELGAALHEVKYHNHFVGL
jgi:membrane protein